MITLSDGEAIKRVLNDMESFHAGKGFSDSLSTVAPQSLVILSGEDWKRHRKIVSGAFAPTQLKFAMDVTMERLDTMLNKWETLSEVKNVRFAFSNRTRRKQLVISTAMKIFRDLQLTSLVKLLSGINLIH